jgi:hypothetical protein
MLMGPSSRFNRIRSNGFPRFNNSPRLNPHANPARLPKCVQVKFLRGLWACLGRYWNHLTLRERSEMLGQSFPSLRRGNSEQSVSRA